MQARIRVALISDASLPAAEATAARLARDGLRVLRNYPDGLPDGIAGTDSDHAAFPDVRLADVEALADWAYGRAGHIDHLIVSDNVIFPMPVETISEEQFATFVDRNAKSAFLLSKVFGMRMAADDGGTVTYISSLHDDKPTGCAVAYSAGRGAVQMLSKEMALFLGRKGMRCNLVEMGTTRDIAPALDSHISPFNYDIDTKVPLGKLPGPEDCAAAVAWLISDDAAAVNGASLRIDGGHLLRYLDR